MLTRIVSYSGNRFGTQSKGDRKYYEAYLRKVKKAGLNAAVLEYTKSSSMRTQIIKFCNKNKYSYYISSDVHLK